MINEPADWDSVKAKIHQRYYEVGTCWEWTGSYINNRPTLHYTNHKGRSIAKPARQLVAFLWGRKLTNNSVCVPSCKNPHCINPEHIAIISKKESLKRASKAMVDHGNAQLRAAKIAATRRERCGKISWDDAEAIRNSTDSLRTLSKRYGISMSMAWRIKTNKAWIDRDSRSNPFAALMR